MFCESIQDTHMHAYTGGSTEHGILRPIGGDQLFMSQAMLYIGIRSKTFNI